MAEHIAWCSAYRQVSVVFGFIVCVFGLEGVCVCVSMGECSAFVMLCVCRVFHEIHVTNTHHHAHMVLVKHKSMHTISNGSVCTFLKKTKVSVFPYSGRIT